MTEFIALVGGLALFVLAAQGKLDPLIHALVVGSPKAIKS